MRITISFLGSNSSSFDEMKNMLVPYYFRYKVGNYIYNDVYNTRGGALLKQLFDFVQKKVQNTFFYFFLYRLLLLVSYFCLSRRSYLEVFLAKGVLKIYSKLTGEHPCRSSISIKLQSNFTEITLRLECFPVHMLYIFRSPFAKNTSG